jgi:hypothetical protein
MTTGRRLIPAGVACLVLAASLALSAQDKSKDKDSGDKEKEKRPKLTLTARPPIAMSPARVSLTAELAGGPDDLEDFYCPTIEWDWGDGTSSETTSDCDPYEAGKSTFRRRFTVEHVSRGLPSRLAASEEARQADFLGDGGRRRPPGIAILATDLPGSRALPQTRPLPADTAAPRPARREALTIRYK